MNVIYSVSLHNKILVCFVVEICLLLLLMLMNIMKCVAHHCL
jgi:hypothetical protein